MSLILVPSSSVHHIDTDQQMVQTETNSMRFYVTSIFHFKDGIHVVKLAELVQEVKLVGIKQENSTKLYSFYNSCMTFSTFSER
jgi:hypothetical protein